MKKTIILLLLSFIVLSSGSLSKEKITSMISEIKQERVGINLSTLETTLNPFIIVKIEENLTEESTEIVAQPIVIVEPVYELDAVLNHAGFINKKWYKVGQTLGDYKIKSISKTTVILKSPEKEKILSLKKKKTIKLH